jgi:hypothetical protein
VALFAIDEAKKERLLGGEERQKKPIIGIFWCLRGEALNDMRQGKADFL